MRAKAVVVRSVEEGAKLEEIEVDPPARARSWCGWRRRASADPTCTSSTARRSSTRSRWCSATKVPASSRWVGTASPTSHVGDHVVHRALRAVRSSATTVARGKFVNCNGNERIKNIFGGDGDGTTRIAHHDGTQLYPMVGTGTPRRVLGRAQTRGREASPKDIPLDVICLAGCGVTTGLGAVLNIAEGAARASRRRHRVRRRRAQRGAWRRSWRARPRSSPSTPTRRSSTWPPTPAPPTASTRAGTTMHDAVQARRPGGVDFAFEVVGNADLVAQTFEPPARRHVRDGGLAPDRHPRSRSTAARCSTSAGCSAPSAAATCRPRHPAHRRALPGGVARPRHARVGAPAARRLRRVGCGERAR